MDKRSHNSDWAWRPEDFGLPDPVITKTKIETALVGVQHSLDRSKNGAAEEETAKSSELEHAS